jgi:uncharacterized membrane protein YvlD (DUF360 family)
MTRYLVRIIIMAAVTALIRPLLTLLGASAGLLLLLGYWDPEMAHKLLRTALEALR